MKRIFFLSLLVIILSSFSQEKKLLKVTITGLKDVSSTIMVGVYRKQDGFPGSNDKKPFRGYNVKPEGTVAKVSITDLEYGEYAVAVYQDTNSDSKLNTGMFGIPKEPYAFSNNFKPKLSAPKYDDCKFVYSATKHEISIVLLD